MLSGRSTVSSDYNRVERVLDECCFKLGLADDNARMELLHGSERVPRNARVKDFPGLQPRGEISEYDLVIMR
eukprot:2439182-Amphidinium_carterae.1